MTDYTFRITQDVTSTYYNGKVTIQAKDETDAKSKLTNLKEEELEKIIFDWEINLDNAQGEGDIEIHEII